MADALTMPSDLLHALARNPSPLLFAVAGEGLAQALLQPAGPRVDELVGAMRCAMEAVELARGSAVSLRIHVGSAALALALADAGSRERVLSQLPVLVWSIAPPDWFDARAQVVERAMVELAAARPAPARRCAWALVERGEPQVGRWIRIAADQIDRGYPVVNLESGLLLAARDRRTVSPMARVGARLVVGLGARAPVPIGGYRAQRRELPPAAR